ncbi:hypothetical protein [Aquimarina muelleri]|uniref:Alpha/beta hydrolase n=1 Tax=Aquimarina muelleri TaxID=279356 RepID=A0A918N5L8_9FLAO|nr:hypothetical protein [Aquimarina muelleri]MCX2763825.1 alpha/beta hydrolase [Aquimarina muelleri]GGX31361.1 hypothetical protein GCM10007384_35540 [Aquimarina muelleri]
MAKQKLLILSDLWGLKKSDWLPYYTDILNEKFEIQYYDCCTLGKLNTSKYTEEALHQQFVNGGIELAVQNLIDKETEIVHILAFSIGGTIAWQSMLKGLKVASLYAVSATRLRYETNKPDGDIKLYFGETDTYAPNKEWLSKMNNIAVIKNKKGHSLYTEPEFARELSTLICETIQ